MEARKSHIVLSASWRAGKAGHVTYLKSEDLRNTGVCMGSNCVNSSLILKVQEPET